RAGPVGTAGHQGLPRPGPRARGPARAGVDSSFAAGRQRARPDPPPWPAEGDELMSITILRTADAWWLGTPGGPVRIDTDATTTGGLLANSEHIETARGSTPTVDPATLDLVSPGTAPSRGGAQMTNFPSPVN